MIDRGKLSEGLRLLAELLALDVWGDEQEGEVRKSLATLLGALPAASRLGTALHNACWQQTPMVAIEAPVLRVANRELCVWLARRGEGEAYAGQWHCPGTILRASDGSLEAAITRLSQTEFRSVSGGGLRLQNPEPIAVDYSREERGMMVSLLMLVKLTGNTTGVDGLWMPCDEALRHDDLVPAHRRLIALTQAAWTCHPR